MQNTLIATIIASLFLANAAHAGDTEKVKTHRKKQVLLTKAAKKTLSSGIRLDLMDTSVRPQDDFFRFVSGKWLATATIPADQGSYGAFDELEDSALQQSWEIIQSLATKNDLKPGTNAQKIADVYNSFMNEARLEERDFSALKADFDSVNRLTEKGEMPLLMSRLSRMDVSTIFNAGVMQDGKDSSKYTVSIGQGGLSLPDRDYYLKLDDAKLKAVREAYLVHIAKMLTMAGEANTEQAAATILALETELAKIQWSKVENRNPVKTYNRVEVDKLPGLLSNFSWTSFFKANGTEGKTDYVVVRQPSYIASLGGVIDATPIEVWQHYFKWRLLNAYAPFLSKRFVDQDFAFNRVTLRGIPENQPRWKRGVARVEESLSEALGQLYVEKYFPAEDKARMQVLVTNLLLAYKQSIETLPWMSAATKQEALTKLAKFTPKIAYPDKWRDYSALTIFKDDLIGNVKAGHAFAYQRDLDKLGKPVDRAEWGMSPQTVNAYYNSRRNEIVFPAAILRPPFFNSQADDAVNYGAIGAVIGHEIGHGFDDSGSQSDGDGNLRDWWTPEDKANFGKLTAALVEQYNQYSPVEGYYVNGKLTLGENIGDNSGLSIAYKAYQLSLKGKTTAVIDGFTGHQRVFIGWGQVWREKARETEMIRLISTDAHSPSMFRTNGSVKNLDGFYEAFNVKVGDKLYLPAEQRIRIW